MKKFFKIRIEAQVLQSLAADSFVSEAFDQSQVIESIMQTLGGAFVPNMQTLTYVVQDEYLYVQGLADEAQERLECEWLV